MSESEHHTTTDSTDTTTTTHADDHHDRDDHEQATEEEETEERSLTSRIAGGYNRPQGLSVGQALYVRAHVPRVLGLPHPDVGMWTTHSDEYDHERVPHRALVELRQAGVISVECRVDDLDEDTDAVKALPEGINVNNQNVWVTNSEAYDYAEGLAEARKTLPCCHIGSGFETRRAADVDETVGTVPPGTGPDDLVYVCSNELCQKNPATDSIHPREVIKENLFAPRKA